MMLRIDRPFYNQMLTHAQAEYPLEACGILAGQAGQVTHLYAVDNILRSPTAYEMEPRQQLAAMSEIEEHGWEMLAVYHSHPQGPERPSPTDVAQAYYPEVIQVIISLSQPAKPCARAFTIVESRVEEIDVVVQP